MNQKGTLIFGVEHEGKTHKEFVMRPARVRDSVELMEDERCARNEAYLGVCMIARQIERLGDIDEVTPEMVMDMTEDDFEELVQAQQELAERQRRFRAERKGSAQADSGHGEAGVQPG